MNVRVIAHTRSKHPRIEQADDGVLHVYVAEPAYEGKANKAVIVALSKHLSIPKSCITITKGIAGKKKVVELVHCEATCKVK